MTEFELLQKLKQESQQNAPDLFDKIMSSAQNQGIIKRKNISKNDASRIAKRGTMKSKVILGIATFAVGIAAIGGAVAIGLINDGGSSETTGGGSSSSSGSSTTHTCEFVFDSTVDPKCEEQGYDLYTCTCGKSEKRDFKDALGHGYINFRYNNDATCDKDGTRTGECEICGIKATLKDPAHPAAHKWAAYEQNNGDCQHKGYIKQRCWVCNIERTVDKDYGNHNIIEHQCNICGETFQGQKGTFNVENVVDANNAVVSDLGKITIEFEYITYQNNTLVYTMNIVQTYTLNGQQKVERYDVTVPQDTSKGGVFRFKLYSTRQNRYIDFEGWMDYDVYVDDGWMTFIVGCYDTERGNSDKYSFEYRYYLYFEN